MTGKRKACYNKHPQATLQRRGFHEEAHFRGDKAIRAYDIKGSLMDGGIFDFEDNPWFPAVLLPFEGKEYPAPAQYDKLLKPYYGNYWELPPEDKRKPSHDQGFYLIDS